MGVGLVSLSAADPQLSEALAKGRDQLAALGMGLVWNLPVPYSAIHPVALEAGDALIEGAGRAWLYIEPDGDLRPAQGNPDVLGNLLRDDWECDLERLDAKRLRQKAYSQADHTKVE